MKFETADVLKSDSAPAIRVWVAALLGVVAIALVDYSSGFELRVFPLYYAPISLVAWHQSRLGAVIVAILSALFWVGANFLAGLSYSHPAIWVGNVVVQATSFILIGILISSLRAALIREQSLSRVDALTSMLNSRAFYEEARLLVSLCRRKGRPITVAYLDLDNFKEVNDQKGHHAGDELLRSVAELLRASVRPTDLSARLGGDEFAILLLEVGPDDAIVTLKRIQSLLENMLTAEMRYVTASIGAVTFTNPLDNIEDMIKEADAVMYKAKSTGKNRVHHHVYEDVDGHSLVLSRNMKDRESRGADEERALNAGLPQDH